MRAEEVSDTNSLRAWFSALPNQTADERNKSRRFAVAVAHRASIRLLPLALSESRNDLVSKRHLTTVIMLRLFLSTGVEFVSSSSAIRANIFQAARPYTPAALGTTDLIESHLGGNAVSAMLDASFAAAANDPSDAAAASADAADALFDAVPDVAIKEIQFDLMTLEANQSLLNEPLWRCENPFESIWGRLRHDLLGEGQVWAFWIDWYEKALAGAPQDWAGLLTEIALIPAEDWDEGAEHVNALIAEIVARRAVSLTPYGEEIVVTVDGKFDVRVLPVQPRATLETVCIAVGAAVDRLADRAKSGQTDLYAVLREDSEWIQDSIRRYPDHPILLHDEFGSVWRSLEARMNSGELPRGDRLLDHLARVLDDAQIDLRREYPEVGRAHRSRTMARLRRFEERTGALVTALTPAVATLSTEALGAAMTRDAKAGADGPDAETEDTARYRWLSRFARIFGIARKGAMTAADDMQKLEKGLDAATGLAERGHSALRELQEKGAELLSNIL